MLDVRRVSAMRVNHEAATEDMNREADHEDFFPIVSR